MSGVGQSAVERLRSFLGGLQPGSRALLIAELERGILRGDDIGGSELILTELHRSVRDADPAAQRVSKAERLFFEPLEPFLIDDSGPESVPGRISRAALPPVWRWISTQLAAERARIFVDRIDAARTGDEIRSEILVRDFQDHVVERMRSAFEAVTHDAKAARRLGAQIGTPRGLEDAGSVLAVLGLRDRLAAFGSRLPGHIKALSGPQLEASKTLLDPHADARAPIFLYSLVMLLGRLAQPWQLIRLATNAAHSDAAARIAETPYALAVTLVLGEVGRMVDELEADLKSGRGIAVAARLKAVHDALRGLRSEIDPATDTVWGRQLAVLRARISRTLTGEIEAVPGRARRLLRIRPSQDVAPDEMLDSAEVDDTEARIAFAVACRNFAGELAINEVTRRTTSELQQTLDSGTRGLLDALRAAGDTDRRFRQSQVDAAVRFCALVFGNDYAALLTKAAEVAAHVMANVADPSADGTETRIAARV